ncbi:phage tail sheath family protein [Tepidibacter hydrothermalis]|uniref:Phage tail sheath family protein n=1 Tax=Tepidibacter hydrothermalis TaxID=3036126 RepID=A0ABY8EJK9_9FIRM|nr:phage tail sheath family protein [Tepidibacter hydrothermalis]WFD12209.1 phage tail sheath family protein [Tepidibacter hydrothermalis]
MALGGGTFVTQNKVLPGSYINFVSLAKASATLSNRGIAAMPLELDWGVENAVFEVTKEDFQKNSLKIFGYAYTDDKLKGLRDLFMNIKTLYAYRLTSGGVKATNTFATAKYCGIRGNDLKIVIQANVDVPADFDVKTVLGTTVVDEQTVSTAAELVANDYVTFKSEATLVVTASTPLTGGTNGTVDGTSHQNFLDKIEAYSYNALGVVTTDDTTKGLYMNFNKRIRDDVGQKFQAVLYNKAADYEGVVNVKNATTEDTAALVYWVTGIIAGCEVNKSNLNKKYDGEYTVEADYTQSQLEAAILAGEFTLHKVGSDIRVLSDINSLVTVSDTKGEIFKDNQTVRVMDQIANDIAVLFNTKYLGTVPNDAAGRISLWSDIVKHHEQLAEIRAIENFSDSDVVVDQGNTKKSVVVQDAVTVVNAMAQLYMTVVMG